MKAVRIERTGGPEVLEVVDLPVPRPGPNEVLVRNVAIGVGMPDMLVRRGVYAWMPTLPAIVGIESAGVIESVGVDVEDLRPGQSVYVNARDLPERSGGYAAYRLASAAAVHVLPPGVSCDKAAALGNYQVAELLLRMGSAFPAPTSVAIYGAAGGVGSAAVQLARARGWQTIAVAGSVARCEFALANGADTAVDHRQQDVVGALLASTGGRGVDLILDSVGGTALPSLFGALAPLGTVVSYGFLDGEPNPLTVPAMRRRFGQSPAWRLFSMHSFDALPGMRRALTASLVQALSEGTIDPHIHATFNLAEVREAHLLFEQRTVLGKLLLKP